MLNSQVYAAIAGAILAGLFAMLAGLLAHRKRIERTRLEADQRNAEWKRDRLVDFYSNAIYYLYKSILSMSEAQIRDKDVRQHISEAQRYVFLLTAYHSGETATKLAGAAETLSKSILKNMTNVDQRESVGALWDALQLTRQLLSIDGRVTSSS